MNLFRAFLFLTICASMSTHRIHSSEEYSKKQVSLVSKIKKVSKYVVPIVGFSIAGFYIIKCVRSLKFGVQAPYERFSDIDRISFLRKPVNA